MQESLLGHNEEEKDRAQNDAFGLAQIHGNRLFAEHVLSGLCGSDGHLGMKGVGGGNVDGIDIRVGQEFLVRTVGARRRMRRQQSVP